MKKTILLILVIVFGLGAISGMLYGINSLSNYIIQGEQEQAAEKIPFGGTTVLFYDFSEEFKLTEQQNWRQTESGDWGYFSLGNENNVVTGGKDGTLKVTPFGRNIISLNHRTDKVIDNYSVITYDIDVSIPSDFNGKLDFRPNMRNDSNVNLTEMLCYENNMLVNTQNGETYSLKNRSFHLTCAIYEADFYYFVDGEFLCKIDKPYSGISPTVDKTRGFWIDIYEATSAAPIVFDNFVWNVFDKDYEGAILDIFENTHSNLKNNSDTVLGGCMND